MITDVFNLESFFESAFQTRDPKSNKFCARDRASKAKQERICSVLITKVERGPETKPISPTRAPNDVEGKSKLFRQAGGGRRDKTGI
jgi:hypothetical protein